MEKSVQIIANPDLSGEANCNLSYREFLSDMEKMGFFVRDKKYFSQMFYHPLDSIDVEVHVSDPVRPETLREVETTLILQGWFDHPENLNKFPFDKWRLPMPNDNVDSTRQDIREANEKYWGMLVIPVFQMKNSICVMGNPNGGLKAYNLCRGVNDRRPILPDWYDYFEFDKGTGQIPCLKRYNRKEYLMEAYPIKTDGTLDTRAIIESKTMRNEAMKCQRHDTYSYLHGCYWSVICDAKKFQMNNSGIKLVARGDEGLCRVVFDVDKKKIEVIVANPTLPPKVPRVVDLSDTPVFFEEIRENLEEILLTGGYGSVTPNEERTVFEVTA